MKRKVFIMGAICLGCLLSVGIFLGIMIISFTPVKYSTTDLADYGKFTGNYDNKSVESFVTSFFPKKLESSFEDIQYSYRAQKGDAYAYEVYLEFVIRDDTAYDAFLAKCTVGMDAVTFRYNQSFIEYTISDVFQPTSLDAQQNNTKGSGIAIRYARIGKILCCPDENRIIFIALGVYDGGLATTEFFNVYFEQFKIDPKEYASSLVG